MVDDVGQLIGKKANVERMHYRPRPGNAEVKLHVLVVVPCERGDPIPGSTPSPLEHIAQPLHPPIEFAEGVLVQSAIWQLGPDLLVGIETITVFQNAVNGELIVHHQAG